MILAIETATSACSAAVLAADGALVAHRLEDKGPAHTRRLLPFVHEVFEEAAVGLRDLDTIVCGLGPGAYTGIRIGVATARALAQAAGLRLGGVPTLAAVALALAEGERRGTSEGGGASAGAPAAGPQATGPQPARPQLPAPPLVALLDGKRHEVFAQVFRATSFAGDSRPGGAATLEQLSALTVVAADDLGAFLGRWPGAVAGGDGARLYADLLPPGVSTTAEAAPPTAAMVGRAWLARVPGAAEGMAAVLPIYGRAPDATRWQDGGRGSGASGGGT